MTGGAGFIGSNLVKLLLEEQVKICVVDNLSSGYHKNLTGLDVDFVQGDIRDQKLVLDLAAGMDVVFHLAASVGRQRSLDNPQEDAGVNLVGTTNVLEAVRKNNVSRFVYSSSAAIFGELQTLPIGEAHPQNPDSPYGVSKLAAEKQALCYAELYGMDVACLRYFNVYGPNQRYDAYGNVIPIFAERIYNNQTLNIFGDGEQTRDFINVRDVARANWAAANSKNGTGVYNIGSGTQITINELARLMKTAFARNVPVRYLPPRPADVRHCLADIRSLQENLHFYPSADLPTGLAEYIQWFIGDKGELCG